MIEIRKIKCRLVLSLGVLILLALAAFLYQRYANEAERKAQGSALETEFTQLIGERFRLYQYGLRGARGVIQAGGLRDIRRQTFVDYVKTRDLEDEFPGSRGVGYIEIVPQEETQSFVREARRDGFETFDVRELSPNSDTRYLIKYIYPLEGNEGATGLDIGSEDNRRTAAWKAVVTGEAQLTAPITLVQASGEVSQGFLLLLPVYETPDVTSEERIDQAVGWAYSPLVVSEVLKDLGPRRSEIAFSISDLFFGDEFYRSDGFDSAAADVSQTISVFGRDWEVRFHTLPAFQERLNLLDPAVVFLSVLGAGLAIFIAGYSYYYSHERDRQRSLENEKFANAIFDAAPQALIAIDTQGTIVRASPYANSLLAGEDGTLDGVDSSELFSTVVSDALNQLGSQSDDAPAAPSRRLVMETRRLDGTRFMGAISLSRLQLGDQRSLVVSLTDVTAEHEAMALLSESQQRWQELANSLPQLVWTCTATGDCDFLSQRWVEYTGRPLEEQVGRRWLEQVHPDDRDQQQSAWNAAEAAKSSYTAEYRIRSKDGDYRLFFTQAEPILDSAGNIVRWIGSNTDIEDRHQAEQQVRDLLAVMEQRVEQRTAELNVAVRDLRNIVDAMPSLISYWDTNLKNRFANKAFEEWTGKSQDQIVGRALHEIVTDGRYEGYLPYAQAALAGEKSVVESEVIHPRFGRRHIQVHFLPDAENGTVHGYYSLIFDVTALKASEEAQRAARIAAEDATRAKSAFLTSMSHELRTPMNSILGFSDLMRTQHFGALNAKQLEYVELIYRSGEHLLKLMDDVLELSKIEAGKIRISAEPVNVVSVMRSAIAALAPLSERLKVTVQEKNLTDANKYVQADKTRLLQILLNLGSNAIKYNRKDGWVQFSFTELDNGFTRIKVQDNGRGIAMDRQAEVFQPFNRLGAEQGEIEGTGVGLALVKNYVELLGGAIDFESEEGVGSTFWVDHQTTSVSDVPDASAPMGAHDDGAAIQHPMKVLYVEDNEINRMLFENYILVAGNIDYFSAREGVEGLDIARRERPDLIFLDINLPGMSGFDILAEIRNDPVLKDTKVIAISANAMEGDVQAGLKAGFDDYLLKPLRNDRLQKVLQQHAEMLSKTSAKQP